MLSGLYTVMYGRDTSVHTDTATSNIVNRSARKCIKTENRAKKQ